MVPRQEVTILRMSSTKGRHQHGPQSVSSGESEVHLHQQICCEDLESWGSLVEETHHAWWPVGWWNHLKQLLYLAIFCLPCGAKISWCCKNRTWKGSFRHRNGHEWLTGSPPQTQILCLPSSLWWVPAFLFTPGILSLFTVLLGIIPGVKWVLIHFLKT